MSGYGEKDFSSVSQFKQCHWTVSQLWENTKWEIDSDKKDLRPQGDRIINIDVFCGGTTVDDYIKAKAELFMKNGCDDAFYVMNIHCLIQRYKLWMDKLPHIKPFFAVKSNNDPILLSLLANIGIGFDCASKREIELVLGLGVPPDDIIFAHPCKQMSHIRFARDEKVSMMTFDSPEELYKFAAEYKEAKLLVRIKCDDPSAYVPMGKKFGATINEACKLIDTAKTLDLNIVGVSFHIGSWMRTPKVYATAIEMCHTVFEYATKVGYCFTVLDVGGGFPGYTKELDFFHQAADAINISIKKFFSNRDDLVVIAEPGQYFSNPCYSLVVQITNKRSVPNGGLYYYVNDGMFGSMLRWKFVPEVSAVPRSLKKSSEERSCTIWGPTAASVDKLCETVLPIQNTGDWLVFDELGAYSLSLHSEFNGYPRPQVVWFLSTSKC